MGNHMSTKSAETSTTIIFNDNFELKYELNSYEDQDLQSFYNNHQVRTNQVIINTVAGQVEVQAPSLDSLREVTQCLLEMNQQVAKVTLKRKRDIWNTEGLFELIEEYFENSLQTLDFCAALDKCLKRARDSQLHILIAVQQLEREDGIDGNKYKKTLDELKKFRADDDPFTGEFMQIFQSVYTRQMLMLDKLQHRENKHDKKYNYYHAWRKISGIIFATTLVAVMICSVVAAAMAAPPVAAALAAATAVPVGSVGRWTHSSLKIYENAIKGQKEVLSSMQVGTKIAIKDLDNIRVCIDRLEIEIESLLHNAEFAIEEEAVKIGIEEIKKEVVVFMKRVEDLGKQGDTCSRDVCRARTAVPQRMQRIIKCPGD
ncbi:transmembrane protein, putative [Actinidia rufa]|uniref:Transmembrane protein, putative n=1 Tax=Actinidia rufa TaxID=165716 RepID=A0A7J0DFT0_9ERIC|nr:transmembrane protein, putative [Actinidia rufa]